MVEVAQGIPLARTLRVELDLVVISMGGQWGVDEGHDLVRQAFAPKAWRLDRSDGPVQGDRHSVFELLVGVLDDIRGDDVESAEDVLLAVLVEDAPSAAWSSLAMKKCSPMFDTTHLSACPSLLADHPSRESSVPFLILSRWFVSLVLSH